MWLTWNDGIAEGPDLPSLSQHTVGLTCLAWIWNKHATSPKLKRVKHSLRFEGPHKCVKSKSKCKCVRMRGRGGQGRIGEEHTIVVRAGCRAGGGGKVFVARGRAGLTGQQQRRLVPPGFPLKTHDLPTPEHLTHVSPLSLLPPLSPLLSSLLLLFLPSITLR